MWLVFVDFLVDEVIVNFVGYIFNCILDLVGIFFDCMYWSLSVGCGIVVVVLLEGVCMFEV